LFGLANVVDLEAVALNRQGGLHRLPLVWTPYQPRMDRMGMKRVEKILLHIDNGRLPNRLPPEAAVLWV
jgi:hypothetical protein